MYTPTRSKIGQSRKVDSPFSVGPRGIDGESSPFSRRKATPGLYQQVLEQGPTHQLSTRGSLPPVQVAEILASQQVDDLNANIDPSGWIWLIKSRKLYLWKSSSGVSRKASSCIELLLPATELRHKASLSCVILPQGNKDPVSAVNTNISFVHISPEGIVRFWPNLARVSIFSESNLELDGKDCHQLLNLSPYGCILVTTTNELYLLTTNQSSISCRELTVAGGMLSGISRRVSSFWARAPAEPTTKYPPSLAAAPSDPDLPEQCFYVSSDDMMQKWELSGPAKLSEKMLFEVDVVSSIKPSLTTALNIPAEDIDSVRVLSMKAAGFGIVLLISVLPREEQVCHLLLVTVKISSAGTCNLEQVVVLPHTFSSSKELIEEWSLMVDTTSYLAYVSSRNLIVACPISDSLHTAIKVDLKTPNISIIGSGMVSEEPLFISSRYGLVALKLTETSRPLDVLNSTNIVKSTSVNEPSATPTTTAMQVDEVVTNAFSTMRKAFLAHTNGIKNELSLEEYSPTDVESAILGISKELVDSKPASDPRWAGAAANSFNSTSSVLILKQIKDKDEMLNQVFMDFLTSAGIFPSSSLTRWQLCEISEKIQVAITLHEQYARYNSLLDNVITLCVEGKNTEDTDENLSNADIFFAKISTIDQLFPILLSHEKEKLQTTDAIKDQLELVSVVSDILITCFNSAWQHRQAMLSSFKLDEESALSIGYVPWTGSPDKTNCRSILREQIKLLIEVALTNADSTKVGSGLSQQVVYLADILLDAYVFQLRSLQKCNEMQAFDAVNQEFLTDRRYIIKSLVNLGFPEHACSLAEKNEDFLMLIHICDKSNDLDRLDKYKTMFAEQGFLDVLYNWYMDRGEYGKLMVEEESSTNLASFLSSKNNISWLHSIGQKEFSKASSTLKCLGDEEKILLSRQKTLLVLSQLSLMASDEPQNIVEEKLSEIDAGLELIEYQEQLPVQVLKVLGQHPSTMAPLTAEQLIELYVGDKNEDPDETAYRNALNLLKYASEESKEALSLSIWSRSVLSSKWDDPSQVDPMASISEKMFYKCLKYAAEDGLHSHHIPALKDLIAKTSIMSSELCTNQTLHLLKVCYEVVGLQQLSDTS